MLKKKINKTDTLNVIIVVPIIVTVNPKVRFVCRLSLTGFLKCEMKLRSIPEKISNNPIDKNKR